MDFKVISPLIPQRGRAVKFFVFSLVMLSYRQLKLNKPEMTELTPEIFQYFEIKSPD